MFFRFRNLKRLFGLLENRETVWQPFVFLCSLLFYFNVLTLDATKGQKYCGREKMLCHFFPRRFDNTVIQFGLLLFKYMPNGKTKPHIVKHFYDLYGNYFEIIS